MSKRLSSLLVVYCRAIVVALVACTGCVIHKPVFQAYRLAKLGTNQILIPPGVAAPDVAQRTFPADVIAGAGPCSSAAGAGPCSSAAGAGPCSSAAGVIGIQVRKKRMLVTVKRDTLIKQPPGWLSTWTAELEAQGCLSPGALRVNMTETPSASGGGDDERSIFRLFRFVDQPVVRSPGRELEVIGSRFRPVFGLALYVLSWSSGPKD